MDLHVGEKPVPVDLVVSLQDGVRHVGPVVAVAQLDEALGPDEFGRSHDADRRPEHLDLARVLEPLIADRHGAVRGREDHVEEVLALEDLSEPALVLDLDRIAEALEMRQDAGVVARLAEDVEVLGGAGEQERQTELVELPDCLGVERLRLGVLQRGLGLGADDRHRGREGRKVGFVDRHQHSSEA